MLATLTAFWCHVVLSVSIIAQDAEPEFNAFPHSPPISNILSHELKYAPRSVFHAAGRRDIRCCYVSTKGVVSRVLRLLLQPTPSTAIRSRREQYSRYVKECGISSSDANVPEEKGDIRPSWNDPSEISIACIPRRFHNLLLNFSKKAGITIIDTITVERSFRRDFTTNVKKQDLCYEEYCCEE